MNCTHIHSLLEDALDGQLSDQERQVVDNHLGSCAACRQLVREEQALRAALMDLPVVPASGGFAARAMSHAAEVNRAMPGQKSSFIAGFAAAMVAGVAFLFVAGIYVPGNNTQPTAAVTSLTELSIALHETRRVRVVFNSPRELEQAKVSLELPAHVELAGHPGRRHIAWTTNLKKGENILRLPLSGTSVDSGELIARVEHAGKRKEIRFQLKVDQPGMTSTLEALKSA